MSWQNPWAWAGLVTLVLPVLVHLLSRAPATVRPFPSLRFINASRLSPRRRTQPRDLLLLLVRTGILAAAVAALAGPSVGASAPGSARVVRAIVLDTSASMRRPVGAGSATLLDSARRVATGIVASGRAAGTTSIVIATAQPARAMAGVVSWLKAQPGTHEIVLVSDFQRGGFDSTASRGIPAGYGLRLVRVGGQQGGSSLDSTFTIPADYPATAVRVTARPEATELLWSSERDTASVPAAGATSYKVTLHASDAERARLTAAVAATLGAASIGTVVHLGSASDVVGNTLRVDVVYPGFAGRSALLAGTTAASARPLTEIVVRLATDPLLQEIARTSRVAEASTPNGGDIDSAFTAVARSADGRAVVVAAQDTLDGGARLLLFSQADAGSAMSAALVSAALHASATRPELSEREPGTLSDGELRALERGATDTSVVRPSSPDAMESAGRWLWALALLLLAVEALLRRVTAPQLVETAERDEAIAA